MQRHVRELVSQHGAGVTGVGAGALSLNHDASRIGKCDRTSPLRRRRAGPLTEMAFVRRDGDDHPLPGTRETGEGVRRQGARRQRCRQLLVAREKEEDEAASVQTHRGVLAVKRRGQEERESQNPTA